MKQITPAQHLKASTTSIVSVVKYGQAAGHRNLEDRFCKVGESQDAAIKRFMATRKRHINKAERREFSKDVTTLANTKAYVENFYRLNGLGTPPFTNLSTSPTTWPSGPEVEFHTVDECIDDLI